MELTTEQQEKLTKLEEELAAKFKYEESSKERRIATSKRTGIPYDIVDIDVVKFGTMLGLIRSLDKRESSKDEDDISLIDIFMNMGSQKVEKHDYSKIPSYFTFSPRKIQESIKSEQHIEHVKTICNNYWIFISDFLIKEYENVEKSVSLSIQQLTPESFTETVKETMNVILEMLIENQTYDTHNQLKVLRNSLLSFIPICEYKILVTDHINQMIKKKINPSDILKHNLSYIDATLSLFPGFETVEENNIISIMRSLVVRAHTKDPKLSPLDISAITKECCTPLLLYVHLADVLKYSMIGPYSNNPIGFLKISKNYYILKCITSGIRMWIRDDNLRAFSKVLRKSMLMYTLKTLKTLENFKSTTNSNLIKHLSNTIDALNNPVAFRKLVCSIISSESVIIPSELDVFDCL